MDMLVSQAIERQKLLKTPPDTTVAKAARLMGIKRVGAIAVVDGERLVGIFTERDALVRVIAQGRDPVYTRVEEVMTRAPVTVGPEETLESARSTMRRLGFRHMPVVAAGQAVGMLSTRET
ncbi:MAG TPA: CBS domain-containing protein [Usitatibacter sp.]|nr:CBS domain-containing protein [Usitatibacter sp.]